MPTIPKTTRINIPMARVLLPFASHIPSVHTDPAPHGTSKTHVEQSSPSSTIPFPQTSVVVCSPMIEATSVSFSNPFPTIIVHVYEVSDVPSETATFTV